MSNLAWILGLIAAILGSGWIYTSHKNRQIRKYEQQNRDLAEENAKTKAEKSKSEQKADSVKAASDLNSRIYKAILERKEAERNESTAELSEEDRKSAKDIMDDHRY